MGISATVPPASVAADPHLLARWLFAQDKAVPEATMTAVASRVSVHAIALTEAFDGVSCSPVDPTMIVAWDKSTGIWESLDGGATLTTRSDSMSDVHLSCHTGDWTADGKTLFLARLFSNIGEVCTVTEIGITTMDWPISPWDPQRAVMAPYDPAGPEYVTQKIMTRDGLVILARTPHRHMAPYTVYASSDHGVTWSECGAFPNLQQILPTESGCLLVATTHSYDSVQISADLGKSWTAITMPQGHFFYPYQIAYCRTRDRLFLCSHQDLIQLSFQGELLSVATIAPLVPYTHGENSIDAIVVDPSDPRVIYLSGGHVGLMRSLDGGASWRALPLPRPRGAQPRAWINDYCALTSGPAPKVVVTSENQLWMIDDTAHPDDLFPDDLATAVASHGAVQP